MTLILNNLLSKIDGDYKNEIIYPVIQKKRTSLGRVKLRVNETFFCSTSFDEVARADASPRKKTRYVQHKEKFTNKEIKEHIDIKIRLFADTLSKVRNTPFHYSIGRTHAQGVSAGKIKIRDGAKTYTETLQAVHSSALPVLFAQNREEYERWQQGLIQEEPAKYIYIAKSSYDFNQNSTRNLPALINLVDRILEGGAKNEKLRLKMIEIINQTAKGNHTIEEGVQLFLKEYQMILEEKVAELSVIDKAQAKVKEKACRVFLKYVKRQAEEINNDYISTLLDLPSLASLENEEKNKAIDLKCGMAVKTNGIESAISHEMSPLKRQALGRRKRSPHNFNAGMMRYIFENIQTFEAKRALLRQFNVSLEQLVATGDCENAYNFIKNKKIDISKFEDNVKARWEELQTLKNSYRIDLIEFFLAKRGIEIDDSLQEKLSGKKHLTFLELKTFADLIDLDIKFFGIEDHEL